VADGSSALALRRAGLEDADALVAASQDDEVNLEAVRIAQEAGLLRVIGVAADPERIEDYRALDVEVFAPNSLTARNVEVMLEPRRVASTTFAGGKAEAIEFRIAPDAPVRGKRLTDLHAETWVIAAVLRDGRLIIPHGSTTLEADDRVTVVGAAADFAAIVKTFTSGESRFPLNYGRRVAVTLDSERDLDGRVGEAISLVRNSSAVGLVIVHRDLDGERDEAKADQTSAALEKLATMADGIDIEFRPSRPPLRAALLSLTADESIGTIVVPAPEGGEVLGRRRVAKTLNTYGDAGVPVLLSRGRHPYSSILTAARRTIRGEAAGRAAIDLARTSGASLTGVAVVPPAFVSGVQDLTDARLAAAWLREEASVQSVAVHRKVRRGNPVRVMEDLSEGASLVVLAMPKLPANWLRPESSGHLVRRTNASVLLVPVKE
jgi:Trk K+ transport system NAD-binding subunit